MTIFVLKRTRLIGQVTIMKVTITAKLKKTLKKTAAILIITMDDNNNNNDVLSLGD